MIQGPPWLRARMAALGPCWARDLRGHSEQVKAAYEPLLAAAPKAHIHVTRDLAYGTHPRQVLDVFRPERPAPAPVVVFVHGGAFVRGDKRTTDQIYDNVLYWFARQGCVGVNVEYRLAPEAPHPGGALDVARAMDWVHAHVADHGGDPQRILLIGHSAGGTHVASHVFDPALATGPCRARAIALVSARLRADLSPENPNAPGVRAYYGDDPALHDMRAPMRFAGSSDLPTLVVTAEFENPLLDIYGLEFAWRLAAARRRAPRFMQMAGHNHMSVVAHFNSGEDLLGRQMLRFFEDACHPLPGPA